MDQEDLIPHLFRTEFRKIAAVLCKIFGIEHIEMAEDIASETFIAALETWSYNKIPSNPTAWLYTVAKNKARNFIKRNQLFAGKITGQLKNNHPLTEEIDIDLSEQNISDSQLQMLFAICHPSISKEAQISLSLRILCGFGIEEIANAFLTNKETISKRLFRAREILRTERVPIEMPPSAEIIGRLDSVLTTLYLLFNEGYYSESNNMVLREDLCLEAMRMVYLLVENASTNQPGVNALLSLMCFHSSRFAARKNANGAMVLYKDQDRTLWNDELISRGIFYLHQSARGSTISKYHLEANIAYWHTNKEDTREKWENILQLYNQLLQTEYSPIAALNRTYALSRAKGKEEAITEAEKLHLDENPYYFSLLGELYKNINKDKSRINFQKALVLAKTNADRQLIESNLNSL